MGLIAWALFGIQEIGLLIEDPFKRALKLDVIIDTIYADVIQTMGSQDILPKFDAWALFGIQEIGLIIEDPFKRALKLDVKIDTIYADVIQTLGSQDILPIYQSTPYFANFDHNSPS
eukprot:CAMPEP_0117750994 /NCGR_PEP_ID=MMETSP0947-20121206/10705_1 /TAXON_ID=44440 /ORGANISM="Chattonella subsalsa, Strain CCMP2191" /LENGTH=116 /DNA_ID=CAMNT_0005569279 /DNA_START=1299 /DNA_END=1650 /DNA_ORIENTATION=+